MPSTNDIIELLTEEIACRARIDPAQVKPDAHLMRDLGISSLDLLSVLACAEKELSMHFPDELLGELTSLNNIIEAVQAHQSEEVRNQE
jgi:acyl carrier protein